MKYEDQDLIIGAVLKKYRNEKGLSIRQAGERFKIDNSTVSSWEIGKNSITAKELFKYLEFLGHSQDDFYRDYKICENKVLQSIKQPFEDDEKRTKLRRILADLMEAK